MNETARAALHANLHRGTCPYCSKTLSLVFADDKKRELLVLPEHSVLPKTAAEAYVRNLPICPGSKHQPVKQ